MHGIEHQPVVLQEREQERPVRLFQTDRDLSPKKARPQRRAALIDGFRRVLETEEFLLSGRGVNQAEDVFTIRPINPKISGKVRHGIVRFKRLRVRRNMLLIARRKTYSRGARRDII